MKVEVKRVDGTKRELNIEVSGDTVKNKFDAVFAKIAKEARVPGFRPGHAPRNILEKHYSSRAHEEVLKELIPDVYHQAVAQETLEVIELPEISDVKLDANTLFFKAKVEVSPEITVKNYKGQKINYKKISVTSDEIKRNIDALKETRKIDTVDDNFAKGLGFPNLVELERTVERQIFLQKESHARQKIENEIVENIMQGLSFKAPESMVRRQLEDSLRQAKLDLALKGVSRENIDAQEEALSKELQPQVEKQVRVYLVLSQIAKQENISVDDHMPRKVMELLLREAEWKEVD